MGADHADLGDRLPALMSSGVPISGEGQGSNFRASKP